MQVQRLPATNKLNDDDEAFLTLLSSQRELLNQVKRENAVRGQGKMCNKSSEKRTCIEDDRCFPNRSLPHRRSSIDMLLFGVSKRLSLGLGSDNYVLASDLWFDGCSKDFTIEKKRGLKGADDLDVMKNPNKKRRLSNLGLLSTSFFEDNLASSIRSDPMLFATECDLILGEDLIAHCGDDIRSSLDAIDEDDDEDDRDEIGDLEPLAFDASKPGVDAGKLKETLESFRASMEQSQKSQQAIHDWDRKMGLKRSHSKTMRLSARSRKKLRNIFKSDINTLISKMLQPTMSCVD